MNILLTGATGYLGSHLAKVFVDNGHLVVALKRKTSSLRRLDADLQKKLFFYDIDTLNFALPFKNHGPFDAVVHASTCYGRGGESVGDIFEANIGFPLRLLEIAASYKTGTFLNTDTFFSRDASSYSYLNEYSLSKKQFAEWGRQYSSNRRIRFVNIRLEHLYGPGDNPSKFTTWLVEQCVRNVTSIELTPGEQLRDFIYIDDVTSAYTCLLQHVEELSKGFVELGLGTGKPIRLRDFVELVNRLSHSHTKLLFGALPYRDHEIMSSSANTHQLAAFGWRCNTELSQGIMSMINALKNKC